MRRVLVLPGDGVGPEITAQALAVLNALQSRHGLTLMLSEAAIGGAAVDATGTPLPEPTLEAAKNSQAVLLGAVGGAKWDELGAESRPEAGLLGLRKALDL